MRENNEAHWDKVYTRNTDQQVGWYQEKPITSLRLIEKYAFSKSDSILDIGAGNSHLINELLKSGFQKLALLDISMAALERSRQRLKENESKINLIKGSVLDFDTDLSFNIWHDRAVYHFFHKQDELDHYKTNLNHYLKPGGIFILGAFSIEGPEMCSGLPVNRQDMSKITSQFGQDFELLESFTEDHITPSGKTQNYLFAVLRKRDE